MQKNWKRRNLWINLFIKKLIFDFEENARLSSLKRFKVKVALLTHIAYPRAAKPSLLVQPRFNPLITGTMSNLLHHSHKLRSQRVVVKSLFNVKPQNCIHSAATTDQVKSYNVVQASSRANFKLFIDFLPSPYFFLRASPEQASLHRDHVMLLNVI